ncbi:MAG: SapC family protein [Pseudomonadota bacterium]
MPAKQKDTKKSANGKDAKEPSDAQSNQAPLPLFYNAPIPLDAKEHKDLGLKVNFGLGFTRGVNAVPINMIEMPQICHYYPIGFAPDESATPVAILGLRDNENLFLDDKDQWTQNTYIPAYIRRYPFIFSEIPGKDQLSLCIDLDQDIIESGGDQPFFDKEGKPSQLSQNALEFCKSYHAAAQQTMQFGQAMNEADLLVERQAEIQIAGGKRINFAGFRIIDEEKLSKLDDKVFLEWRAKGWLPFIYAHLFSGSQWQRLTQLMTDRLKEEK